MWGSGAVWNYCPTVWEQYECLELANWSIRANRGMGLNVESLIIESPPSFPPKKVCSFLFTPLFFFFYSQSEIQRELCTVFNSRHGPIQAGVCVIEGRIISSDGIYS